MSYVYVVQLQQVIDREKNILVPKLNLDKAKPFGEIKYILPYYLTPYDKEDTISILWDKLKDFTTDDYLLPIGSPIFIGCATTIAAAKTGGYLKFLQWSNKTQVYTEVKISGL